MSGWIGNDVDVNEGSENVDDEKRKIGLIVGDIL